MDMAASSKKDDPTTQRAPLITWDSKEELIDREGHVRDSIMYLTAGLLSWMESEWGQIFPFVRTSTNTETSEVIVAKAADTDKDAVAVNRVGAQNSAYFSFLVPLRKMKLKVAADRQFNVEPRTAEVEGLGTVFVFPMRERKSVPRNVKEDEAVQGANAEAKAAGKKAKKAVAKKAEAEAAAAVQPEPPETKAKGGAEG